MKWVDWAGIFGRGADGIVALRREYGQRLLAAEAELEAARNELADVAAERDDLRYRIRRALDAHEDAHRALYPGLYT